MFRNLFLAALVAAICAGLVMTVMQTVRLTPLILAAETFEVDAPADAAPAQAANSGSATEMAGMPNHDAMQWAPADGFERTTYTVLATMLMAAGFALVVGAISTLSAVPITGSNALYWAAAGFIVFSLAPSFGLAPNLPGMPVANTLSRQIWWVGTALATGGAILLLVKTRAAWAIVAALALVVAPHVIGAPVAPSEPSGVPPTLSAGFATAVLVNSAVFWFVLALVFGKANDYLAGRVSNARLAVSA